MKKSIPRYTFYKHKYGSELLVDVVELKNVKKFLDINPVHTLTYYDITFVTEGSGSFSIDNQQYDVCPGDVIFSKPGEIRNWDKDHIINGYIGDCYLCRFLERQRMIRCRDCLFYLWKKITKKWNGS